MSGMGDNKTPGDQEEKQPLADGDNGVLPGEEFDSSKVKFINGGATADAVVDIDGQTKVSEDQEFIGLTKEELLQYADDPYWKKVRWVLLICFWVAWVGMLVAAIVIIVLAPKCPPRPKLDWWQKSTVYQVYPRSFQDSDGDGIGDLKGIEQHLDHMRDQLNVTAVWLGPIYPSPMKDLGQDVSAYDDVDPIFGSLEEFSNMKVAMHKRGMKLIMDFIPNHVSDQHQWFQESRKNKNDDNEFRDYFIWQNGKDNGGQRPDPPNNWLSIYGGSAWEWDDGRQQYFYHSYLPEQPDLNLRNEKVKDNLKDVLRFWLAKGVDGFNVDSAANLYESANVTNDEVASGSGGDGYDSLSHTLTTFQPETYAFILELRELIDASSAMDGKAKFLMVDAAGGDINQTMTFYKYQGKPGAHLPLNLNLVNLNENCTGLCVNNLIKGFMNNMPKDSWPNWATGGPDYSRLATRMGNPDWVNAVTMLITTLPGTAFTYYGEEIGMHDVDVAWEDSQDPLAKMAGQVDYRDVSRDFQRTPMQWNGKKNAGFSSNATWLPVPDDYPENNVEAQLAHGAGVSNLEVYSQMTLLRQEPSFQWGVLEDAVVNENILSYVRQAEGFKGYLVAINFGSSAATVNFHAANPEFVRESGIVAAHTANFDELSRASDYDIGKKADLRGVYLEPKEGVVFCWEWEANDAKDE